METASCPLRLERLLVCTDGSPASDGAMAGALSLAQTCGCRIFLLEVMETNLGYTGLAPQDSLAQWEKEVRGYLEGLKARAAELGVAAECLVCQGDAAFAVIIETARDLKPDLIIMGRHGRTGLARLLMGSTTSRVIGLSPVPVLVVPRDRPLELKRILVASDGSPYGEAAWEEALGLARRLESSLTGVSVAREEGELPEAETIVQRMLLRANRQGVPMEIRVRVGAPADVIVQVAEHIQADLIIVGSHGKTGLTRLLMGSTTERVIGQSALPVLVVKKK